MARHGEYFDGGADFERADTGDYAVILKEIEDAERPSFNDPNVMDDVWKWKFTTVNDMDSKGQPYQFTISTKRKYGHEKAALTLLIDGMFKRHLTGEEWKQLDVDKLVGQKFKALVSLEVNPDSQKPYNKVTKLYRPKDAPLKLADVGVETDPFND